MEIVKAILLFFLLWSAYFAVTSLFTLFLSGMRNTPWFLLWAGAAGYGVWQLLQAAQTAPGGGMLPPFAFAGPALMIYLPAVLAAALRLFLKRKDRLSPGWPFLIIFFTFPVAAVMFMLGVPFEEIISGLIS